MKWRWFLPIFITLLWFGVNVFPTQAERGDLPSQLLAYAGKSYKGVQDPQYTSYDLALREYIVKRVNERFGVTLDPKNYSGFDFLEIEALFKCKKLNEPFDIYLKMFPKGP